MIWYPYHSPPEHQQTLPPEIIILNDGAEVAKRQRKRKITILLVLMFASMIGIIIGTVYVGSGGSHRHYPSTSSSVPGKGARPLSSDVGMGLMCFAAVSTPTSFRTDSDALASVAYGNRQYSRCDPRCLLREPDQRRCCRRSAQLGQS